jgi:hypothetical protein
MNKTTIIPQPAIKLAADQAGELIAKLQEVLPLSDDLLAHDRKVANTRMKVPTAAIEAAASILEELEGKAGAYDLDATREALAFEAELGSVGQKLRTLADRLDATIAKRRSAAVATTGGLYASLKGLARADGSMIPHVEQLKPHLARNRRKAKASAEAPAASPAAASTTTPQNGAAVTASAVTITPTGVTVNATKP